MASVLVGISLLGYAQPVQVKADDAETSSSDVQVVFGHIIPVTDNGEEIPNVPHPEYSRDPNDPEKAVATSEETTPLVISTFASLPFLP